MAFDSSIISFTTKTNKVDLVDAAHINAVQSELVAIETILGTLVKGDRANLSTRLNNMMDPDGSVLSGTSYPSPALSSQLYYRTDLTTLYIRNPTSNAWDALGGSLSNVLFQAFAAVSLSTAHYKGASLVPVASAGNYMFFVSDNNTTLHTIWATKWIKISGVATITIKVQLWQNTAGSGTRTARCRVNVGGQTVDLQGTDGQLTPEWVSGTIDVSSLTNGTTYDVTVQLRTDTANSAVYMGNLIAFGS